jgi:xanthosine utilization system XapX-like protein
MKIVNNAPVTIEPAHQEPVTGAPTQGTQAPTAVDPFAKDSIEISPVKSGESKPPEKADEKKPWYDKFIPKTNSARIKTIAAVAGIATGVTTSLLVAVFAAPALPLVILAGFVAAGLGANIAVTAMALLGYGQDSEPSANPTQPNPHLKPGETEVEPAETAERSRIARGPQLTAPDSNPNLRNPEDLEPVARKAAAETEIPKPDHQSIKDAESLV